MVRRMVLGLVALGLVPAATMGEDAAPAPTGALVGRVVDLEGRPVAGAQVWAVAWIHTVGRTATGPDGRFRHEGLKDDLPITLWAEGEAQGLARERREDVHPVPGQALDLGPLALAPGTRVAGRAVDAEGRPVAEADIKLDVYHHTLGHTISSQQKTWNFRADAEGRFESPPLPPGRANVYVVAPGKVRRLASQAVEPGAGRVAMDDVRLDDERPIRGVVVDGDGNPAAGVRVFADYDYENMAATDADGRFALGGVGSEAKQLQLQSNAYFAPKPFPIEGDREALRLEVIKAYTILGEAVDAETGEHVPLDTVRLCRVERDPDDASVTLVG